MALPDNFVCLDAIRCHCFHGHWLYVCMRSCQPMVWMTPYLSISFACWMTNLIFFTFLSLFHVAYRAFLIRFSWRVTIGLFNGDCILGSISWFRTFLMFYGIYEQYMVRARCILCCLRALCLLCLHSVSSYSAECIDEASKWWSGLLSVAYCWLTGDDEMAHKSYPVVDLLPKCLQNAQ